MIVPVNLVGIINQWLNENETIEWDNFKWNGQWLWCDICDIILFEVHTDNIIIWIPDIVSPWAGQYFRTKDINAADPKFFDIIQNEINIHDSNRCRKKK